MSGSTQGTATTARTAPRTGLGSDVETTTGAAPEARQCPTRAEGPQPLFQHRVTVGQCQSKQRGLYHKCFTCVHANDRRG
jgi:hypothetical protein